MKIENAIGDTKTCHGAAPIPSTFSLSVKSISGYVTPFTASQSAITIFYMFLTGHTTLPVGKKHCAIVKHI